MTQLFTEEMQEALYSLAYQLYRSGKYDDAEAQFYVLTTVGTREPKYWFGLASTRQMQKKYKEAIDAYQLAFALKPTDPKISFHAAECFFALGEKAEGIYALECAERAIGINESPDKNLLTHIRLIKQMWS